MKIINYILIIVVSILFVVCMYHSSEFFSEDDLDAIVYINLENRKDRHSLLTNELDKMKLNNRKIHKISGVYIPKNGHKGCVQSHILALNMIKLNKWKKTLILEDDAEFLVDLNQVLKDVDNEHWDVIMLATANKQYINDKGYKLKRLQSATTSSAYIIKDTYVDTLLGLFNQCNDNTSSEKMNQDKLEPWALDQQWAKLQRNDRWYCFEEDPVTQRNIWSTTESHS